VLLPAPLEPPLPVVKAGVQELPLLSAASRRGCTCCQVGHCCSRSSTCRSDSMMLGLLLVLPPYTRTWLLWYTAQASVRGQGGGPCRRRINNQQSCVAAQVRLCCRQMNRQVQHQLSLVGATDKELDHRGVRVEPPLHLHCSLEHCAYPCAYTIKPCSIHRFKKSSRTVPVQQSRFRYVCCTALPVLALPARYWCSSPIAITGTSAVLCWPDCYFYCGWQPMSSAANLGLPTKSPCASRRQAGWCCRAGKRLLSCSTSCGSASD